MILQLYYTTVKLSVAIAGVTDLDPHKARFYLQHLLGAAPSS